MRLLLALMLLLSALPSTGNQQQRQPKEQNCGTAVTPNPGGGVTVVVNEPATTPQTQATQTKTHYWHEWFWPPIWSNWAIVLVAAITAMAALDSLEKLREQAASTEKAANAARDNAEAVMSGERAWLLVDIVDPDDVFASRMEPKFKYRVRNYGNTPGFTLSANAYIQLEKTNDWITNDAFLGHGGMTEDVVLTRNSEPLLLYGNDISAGDRQFLLSEEDRNKIFANPPQAYLFAVGSIHYHDVFEKVRHTPFAYWYNVSSRRFVKLKSPGYNKPV